MDWISFPFLQILSPNDELLESTMGTAADAIAVYNNQDRFLPLSPGLTVLLADRFRLGERALFDYLLQPISDDETFALPPPVDTDIALLREIAK